jgi:hypothetical protein
MAPLALTSRLSVVRANTIPQLRLASILTADSDDLARVYRPDLAQDSEMISPTIPI